MSSWSRVQVDALVTEAVVDCYDEDEQFTGLFTMVESHLTIPFATRMLGVEVTVRSMDLRQDGIVAICHREWFRRPVAILDLPLPDPPPDGVERIATYRDWARSM
ncbi:MAG TPA: hypothetical protein VFC19_12290 [Candidatus Limnocylindrales bacterium]|nr:hypothetical protein [Candidatus Limnocylindrales bacterium]